jgi:hypothetical protein
LTTPCPRNALIYQTSRKNSSSKPDLNTSTNKEVNEQSRRLSRKRERRLPAKKRRVDLLQRGLLGVVVWVDQEERARDGVWRSILYTPRTGLCTISTMYRIWSADRANDVSGSRGGHLIFQTVQHLTTAQLDMIGIQATRIICQCAHLIQLTTNDHVSRA